MFEELHARLLRGLPPQGPRDRDETARDAQVWLAGDRLVAQLMAAVVARGSGSADHRVLVELVREMSAHAPGTGHRARSRVTDFEPSLVDSSVGKAPDRIDGQVSNAVAEGGGRRFAMRTGLVPDVADAPYGRFMTARRLRRLRRSAI